MLAIDLSVSPKKGSGLAKFENGKIYTFILKSDEDIIKAAENETLVGIDAPLSLPEGRLTIEDKNGPHFRECDIQLKARKFKFFPITIGAMRKLTQRGIRLAEKLKEIGVKVLEIYPGAALDILFLPRKNPKAVNEFLTPFKVKAKTIDESDAAIGVFTLYLYSKGLGWFLEGKDGKILLPNPAIYLGPLKKAKIVERLNRFTVKIKINGKTSLAFLRDTGSLSQYLVKDRKAYVLEKQRGKFPYLLRVVFDEEGRECVVDPLLDELLVKMWLRTKGIFAKKKKIGKHVFDLTWNNCIGEVKGASLRINNLMAFPEPYSKRAEKQILAMSYAGCSWLFFVAHGKTQGVCINPNYPKLQALIDRAEKHGMKVKAFSTTLLKKYYWVLEKEVAFLNTVSFK